MAPRTSSRPLIGLEIDPGSVSAVEVLRGSELSVRRAAVAALAPGVVRDGEVSDPASLTAAIKALWKQERGLGKRVRVGVANQRIVMRWLDLPVIGDPKHLATAVQFAAQDVIPMPLETAVLDWQNAGIIETAAGPRQRVMVVAARRDMIDRVVDAVTAAGLRVDGIDLSAFAMIRAIGGRDPEPTLYLSIGGMTNLAVAEDGECVFTRVSGGGSESIAVELAERRGLTLDHARGWLTHVGCLAPLETIDGDPGIVADARIALDAGVARIAAEVRTSLDFHQAQTEASWQQIEKVVVTGSASEIPRFAEAIAQALALTSETRVVPLSAPTLSVVPGAVTVAAGLAIEERAA